MSGSLIAVIVGALVAVIVAFVVWRQASGRRPRADNPIASTTGPNRTLTVSEADATGNRLSFD